MMQASPYPGQPGMGTGHPAMAHGHPMQMQHSAQMAHPNSAMMGGMHHAMSGPQVTQGGPMVSGMPPNPGTPAPGGPMGNAMAMAHLGGQAPVFQGNHPQMNMGQMQGIMNANMIARQRAMQSMQASNGQIPHGMMNMQGVAMNPQMQQKMMAMPMGQHMQQLNPQHTAAALQQQQQQQHAARAMAAFQAQQQAALHLNQQRAVQHQQHQQQQQAQQQQQQQQQQQAQAQQQQQQAQQQHQQAQQQQQQQLQQVAQVPNLMTNRETEPRAVSQPSQTQPQPAPAPPAPSQSQPQQQSQPQSQPQPNPPSQQQTPQQKPPQPQPPTAQSQPQSAPTPQIKQGDPDEEQTKAELANQQMFVDEALRPTVEFSGQCILQLLLYYDTLANPERPLDMNYWQEVMDKYYSPVGSIRQQIFNQKTLTEKSFQLRSASLARFYHSHFTNGIKRIFLQTFEHTQHGLPNDGYQVRSNKLFVTHEYESGVKVISHGRLSVNFDALNKIEHLHIVIRGWTEHIPRNLLEQPLSPEQNRPSPKINKKNLVKQQPSQRLIPRSPVSDWGVPSGLVQFFEIAEVMTVMDPLMEYYCANQMTAPRDALNQLNQENTQNAMMRTLQQQNMNAMAANGQIQFSNQRMGMNPPNQFQSPALAHLGLPNQQSPHMNHTPSPGNPGHGGIQMVSQMSGQGSMHSSQGPSTNTSPNVSNKRRRPSAIKEEDATQAISGGEKTKPSPRVPKRQKGGQV